MRPSKTLIIKRPAIYREPTLTIRVTHIPALDHEPVNNPVELRVQIVKLGVVGATVLSRAQTTKVLGGFGGEVIKKLEDYTACT